MVTLPAEPPEWVHLMKAGPLEASDGRKWRLDDPARVVAESLAAGRDLAIDYDHQTELVMKTGQAAPAAGWIKALEARDDGIWGRVEWKPTGAEKLKAREYRYLSPTFLARKGNGQVLRILRAALTNSPALTLTALASHQSQDHEDSMDELLKNLIATLGLKGDADAETALARVNALATEAADAKAHMARVAKAAGQAEDADADMLCTAIAGLAAGGDDADPAKFVARAQFDEVANLLRTLTDDRAEEKAEAAVETAMSAGKLVPAARDWALNYAKSDPAGFATYVEAQPVIVKPGARLPGAGPGSRSGAGLDDDELAVCRAMGHDPEAFKKLRDAEEEVRP